MYHRHARALRTLTLITTLLAVAVVATAGSAAARKPSCKSKREHRGCQLKKGADYQRNLSAGFADLAVASRKKLVVSFRAHGNFKTDPNCLPMATAVSATIKKGAKVGRSYKFKGRNPKPGAMNHISGTVKIKSAKKASFKGSFKSVATVNGKETPTVLCARSPKGTLKRSN